MKKVSRFTLLGACIIALSSCATTINGSTDTTLAVETTTTTIATPTGTILELVNQLIPAAEGLGEAIIASNSAVFKQKVAQADAIWAVLKPQLIESKIDVVENMQSIIDLFHSAVERKRPADADKALRFLPLVEEAITPLVK
jgi:hypothetical protein